ncbi:tripartite tricarboxylate transporter substrate binding protein [Pusillimonas sp. SM2304]|uniref:Bug family tripartite tricarboxylate transporter substrate binding protein n=1 Tax=Pusillimonas sp. SM2304 TaxID=3073241 RepID=UPI0028765304|nr:tripartite tricarboxylate transporter substrate binding protein [Pusillimonas sp. SM2304]MDS1141671.1 tripartite tricarboxylate transporter substrate binding protein [Pusillimonas sp. SM2304]
MFPRSIRTTLLAGAIGLLCLPLSGHAQARNYPDKPLTFVVPFGPGSATDQLARAIGQGVTEQTGQAVVIENKPGASAMIGASDVARAAPDGYRVLITTNTSQSANPHLYKKLSYDPVKDFEPVTLLGTGGQIMVVNPASPAKTVEDFIKLAKENPGKLSFGSGSSSSRVAGELFQQMAGIQLLHVPYKSNPLVITDLLGEQIDMMMADMATGLPQVKADKLRALGVTTVEPSPLAPEVPTIAAAGVPGYQMGYWFGAYVPANTPEAVVSALHDLLVNATTRTAAQQFYTQTGTQPVTSTPAELADFQKQETEKWGGIIKNAGIQPS